MYQDHHKQATATGTLATAGIYATEGTPTMVASNSNHWKGCQLQQMNQDLHVQATPAGTLATEGTSATVDIS
jgi:hypothetical protein